MPKPTQHHVDTNLLQRQDLEDAHCITRPSLAQPNIDCITMDDNPILHDIQRQDGPSFLADSHRKDGTSPAPVLLINRSSVMPIHRKTPWPLFPWMVFALSLCFLHCKLTMHLLLWLKIHFEPCKYQISLAPGVASICTP
jgi:hypothetical protein